MNANQDAETKERTWRAKFTKDEAIDVMALKSVWQRERSNEICFKLFATRKATSMEAQSRN